MRETFDAWWATLPQPGPAGLSAPTDPPAASTLERTTCACGTPILRFASARQPPERCSFCIGRSRIEGQIWHSTSQDPTPAYRISQLAGELLSLLQVEWRDGEYGLCATLYFTFCEEPLLPVSRATTGSRDVLRALRELGEGPALIGFAQVGRTARLEWTRLDR